MHTNSLLVHQNYKDGMQLASSNSHDPFLNSMDNIKYTSGIAKMNTFDAERQKGNIFGTQQTIDSR